MHGVGYALEVTGVRLALVRAWDLLAPPARPGPLDQAQALHPARSAPGRPAAGCFIYGTGWHPAPDGRPSRSCVALLTSQVLAHGMTSPLREMTAAARAMARGDYTRRVRATSRDEVGELARAFNQMAADLAAADRQRRELIANVSHELRTPITALQGVLENIVDGVAAPDPADDADRAGPDRAARPPGHRAARPVPAGRRRRSRCDRVPVDVARASWTRGRAGGGRDRGGDRVALRGTAAGRAVTVDADPARLHQVCANLLDNAARHSPPGGHGAV